MLKKCRWLLAGLFAVGLLCVNGGTPRARADEAERHRDTEELIDSHGFKPLMGALIDYLGKIHDGKFDQTQKVFTTSPAAKTAITTGPVGPVIGRMRFTPGSHLALVSYDLLGDDVVSVVLVEATKDGPIEVKVGIYINDGTNYIGKIDATDDWDRMEQWAAVGTRLPAPFTVTINAPAVKP